MLTTQPTQTSTSRTGTTVGQRLAGYGAAAAYVSAGSVLLWFYVLGQLGNRLARLTSLALTEVVFVVAIFLWIASLAVVGLALERIEHPANRPRQRQVARWANIVALVMTVPLGIGIFVNAGVPVQAPSYLLIYGGVGISLVINNRDARRAGLVPGVLAWLGIVTGVAYILAGIGYGADLLPFGGPLYMVGFSLMMVFMACYIVWAIWMGVRLSRSKAIVATAVGPTS